MTDQELYIERIKAIYSRFNNSGHNLLEFMGKTEPETVTEYTIRGCYENIINGFGPFALKSKNYIAKSGWKILEDQKYNYNVYYKDMIGVYLEEKEIDGDLAVYPTEKLINLLEDYYSSIRD